MRLLNPFALISLCLSAQAPSPMPEQVHLDRLARRTGQERLAAEWSRIGG